MVGDNDPASVTCSLTEGSSCTEQRPWLALGGSVTARWPEVRRRRHGGQLGRGSSRHQPGGCGQHQVRRSWDCLHLRTKESLGSGLCGLRGPTQVARGLTCTSEGPGSWQGQQLAGKVLHGTWHCGLAKPPQGDAAKWPEVLRGVAGTAGWGFRGMWMLPGFIMGRGGSACCSPVGHTWTVVAGHRRVASGGRKKPRKHSQNWPQTSHSARRAGLRAGSGGSPEAGGRGARSLAYGGEGAWEQ